YQTHLYSIGLDGNNVTALTPSNANHTVSLSPDHFCFVDNSSRPDLPGEVILRSVKDGSQIRVLEQTDASELLKENWKFPEAFQGKAKDGATDLYGLIWRPSNFDATKKYPIIEMVYTAAHAMLAFPDFYKVGIAITGDHDARLDKAWWNELYQGFPVGPDYAEQSNVTMADRLQGHLLIEHGDVDDNVHVVETMRFADAL